MSPLAHAVAVMLLLPASVLAFVVPINCWVVEPRVGIRNMRQSQARTTPSEVHMSVVRDEPGANKGEASITRTGTTSRGFFLHQQGVLAVSAIGMTGLSRPSNAAGLLDFGQNDVIQLEEVPRRTVIGKTRTVKWANVATEIAVMRTEARDHFAKTGATGGREVSSYSNTGAEGSDVTVGLEVSDATGSPALGDGFTASLMAVPGQYLRDDHASAPGFAPWVTFMSRIPKMGYVAKEPYMTFEVYSGTGGKESVTMYAGVTKAEK